MANVCEMFLFEVSNNVVTGNDSVKKGLTFHSGVGVGGIE